MALTREEISKRIDQPVLKVERGLKSFEKRVG